MPNENTVVISANEYNALTVTEYKYRILSKAVFNGAELNYRADGLNLDGGMEVLRAIEPERYEARLKELKEARCE